MVPGWSIPGVEQVSDPAFLVEKFLVVRKFMCHVHTSNRLTPVSVLDGNGKHDFVSIPDSWLQSGSYRNSHSGRVEFL